MQRFKGEVSCALLQHLAVLHAILVYCLQLLGEHMLVGVWSEECLHRLQSFPGSGTLQVSPFIKIGHVCCVARAVGIDCSICIMRICACTIKRLQSPGLYCVAIAMIDCQARRLINRQAK
jgi:hypothetical protein